MCVLNHIAYVPDCSVMEPASVFMLKTVAGVVVGGHTPQAQ